MAHGYLGWVTQIGAGGTLVGCGQGVKEERAWVVLCGLRAASGKEGWYGRFLGYITGDI